LLGPRSSPQVAEFLEDASEDVLAHQRDSLMRMVGTLLAEQDDESQVSDRRDFSVGSMAKVDALEGGEETNELLAQIA
jgi:hypothetical protein